MIILGLVILIVGFLLKFAILWTIGIVILVIGFVLLLLGVIGHEIGGRRDYWERPWTRARRPMARWSASRGSDHPIHVLLVLPPSAPLRRRQQQARRRPSGPLARLRSPHVSAWGRRRQLDGERYRASLKRLIDQPVVPAVGADWVDAQGDRRSGLSRSLRSGSLPPLT